jgi:hypothetical protein
MSNKHNPFVSKPYEEREYTLDDIHEIKRCADDPIYFIKTYCKLQHPTKGAIPFDLHPFQERMIRVFQTQQLVCVMASRQVGKEQPHSALIATPTGWTTMGDICVGDVVLTPNGGKSTVVDKFPQGIKDVYRITFDDESTAECGLDHLWSVYIRNKKVKTNGRWSSVVQQQILPLSEIIEHRHRVSKLKHRGNFNVRVPLVTQVSYPEADLPLDPYVLGLLLGDGGVSRPHTVSFSSADSELVDSLNVLVAPLDVTFQYSGRGYDYRAKSHNPTCNRLNSVIAKLELTGMKSDTKFIPPIYRTAAHDQRLALLQGLMDTDGTISRRGKNSTAISYTTVSERLRDDIQQLVWSLGGRCSIYIRRPQNQLYKIAYDLFISLPNPKQCFRLLRKRDKCNDTWSGGREQLRRTIRDITLVRQEESSCISIDDPNHLYITNNYTVTHNTQTVGAYLFWYATFHSDKTILVVSNKNSNAMEMIIRIKFMYENTPNFIKAGVTDYNKHDMVFDNGSRIISQATSESSGRGLSISLLFCIGHESKITVRNKQSGEIKQVSIGDMFNELST